MVTTIKPEAELAGTFPTGVFMNRMTFSLDDLIVSSENGVTYQIPHLPDFHIDYDPSGIKSLAEIPPLTHVIALPGGLQLRLHFEVGPAAARLGINQLGVDESWSFSQRLGMQAIQILDSNTSAKFSWNAGVNLGIVHFGIGGKH